MASDIEDRRTCIRYIIHYRLLDVTPNRIEDRHYMDYGIGYCLQQSVAFFGILYNVK